MVNLLKLLTLGKDGVLRIDFDDVVQRSVTVVRDGEKTWPPPPVQVSAAPAPKTQAEVAESPMPKKKQGLSPAGKAGLFSASIVALFLVNGVAPAPLPQHFTVLMLSVVVGFYVIGKVHLLRRQVRTDNPAPPGTGSGLARRTGNELLSLLKAQGTGLDITIDEIHAVDRVEFSQLTADVQHLIRDGLPIGLIFAGLPSAVSDLLNEGVATFLRRADRINLQEVAIAEVTASYSELLGQRRVSISPDLINKAAEATEGYPFLIQLCYYLPRSRRTPEDCSAELVKESEMSITEHPERAGAKRLMSHDRRVERPALTLPATPRPATPILTGVCKMGGGEAEDALPLPPNGDLLAGGRTVRGSPSVLFEGLDDDCCGRYVLR